MVTTGVGVGPAVSDTATTASEASEASAAAAEASAVVVVEPSVLVVEPSVLVLEPESELELEPELPPAVNAAASAVTVVPSGSVRVMSPLSASYVALSPRTSPTAAAVSSK